VNALITLKDQGMLVKPVTQVIHEKILPWMYDAMNQFLDEEDDVDNNVEEVVNDGFNKGKEDHKNRILAEYQRREDLIRD
jgi:hypothetical protein